MQASSVVDAAEPVKAKFGLEKRELWTTSNVVGTPDPPPPFQTQVAYPNLRFASPLAVNVVPGTNRMVIAERFGKIFTFPVKRNTTEKNLLLDVKRRIYGVALHPKFMKNGHVFVMSVVDGNGSAENGSRVSRFTAADPKSLRVDARTERVLFTWRSGGHNGGCLRFGPDGFLYIATGDSSGIADGLQTGQDISDLSGSILRIDVDRSTGKRPYAIPKDNPFVNHKGARPEIYSYGHRQVWKFAFDPVTKRLWAGEVGQDLWEMIHLIKKGGNYGWSVMEGSHPFRPQRPKGPTPIVKPIVEHNHDHFRSITGGYVYRADRLKSLKGAYIYGDYDTGRIWSFRYDGKKVSAHHELVDTQLRVVAFAQDKAGEVYILDFVGGQLHRLVPAPPVSKVARKFPRKLSETGLFASTKNHTPAKGVVPYSVNSPLYSDNAVKDRFIALPGNSKIEFDAVTYPQPAPGAPHGWRFPDGTVLVKTFSMEMEKGNPASLRRLETRILHHERMPGVDNEYGAQVWRGYTYIWNQEQTDAVLLDGNGRSETLSIRDRSAPGGVRRQKYRFPSRAECTLCHTMAAKYVLGANTLQLNKLHRYGDKIANQLETFNHIGLFTKPIKVPVKKLPAMVDYRDKTQPLAKRARAYMHANCSHCHRKWGGGNAEFQLLSTLSLKDTGTVGVRPGQGSFKLSDPRLIVPGNPDRSMIFHRMTRLGLGRMPHVASHVIDDEGVALIRAWIQSLPKKTSGTSKSLFNGKDLTGWKGQRGPDAGEWQTAGSVPLAKNDSRMFAIQSGTGILVNGEKGRTVNLLSAIEHGDCELHVEFCIPKGSNSGIYFQGRYEIQVLDSYGVRKPKYGDCGGVYRRIVDGKPIGGRAPDVNASKPPGEWQSFDIVFRAPRFDNKGRKIVNAKFIRVTHNGRLIHENVDVDGPTVAAAFGDEKPTGPIMLQGDHGPVAYRNLRLRPLAGFEVLSACDGREAVEMICAEHPFLAVLDINMPALDGYGVCQELKRKGEPFDRLPVIFLTTLRSRALEILGGELGAYLQKPVDPDELLEAINTFIPERIYD
eukprot:g8248.t1